MSILHAFLFCLITFVPFISIRRGPSMASLMSAALDEQVRRENAHPVDYRNDQRARAVQQRLSRSLGSEAFSAKAAERIHAEIYAHKVLGPWHRGA